MKQRNNINKNEKLKQVEYITSRVGLREFFLCSHPSSYSQCIVRPIDVVLRVGSTAVIALAYKNSLFHTACNDFAAVTLCIV